MLCKKYNIKFVELKFRKLRNSLSIRLLFRSPVILLEIFIQFQLDKLRFLIIIFHIIERIKNLTESKRFDRFLLNSILNIF